jgi:hypothetical protein
MVIKKIKKIMNLITCFDQLYDLIESYYIRLEMYDTHSRFKSKFVIDNHKNGEDNQKNW